MRTFGSYEAVEELSRTAFGAVYSARKSGAPQQQKGPPGHFVKVFSPPALDDAGQRASTQTENFLAAARLQQKAAQSSRHFAPVHEIGTSSEGAYYVSSLYAMSARRLVMGKVKLTDGDLHALVSAIVRGLKDLRASCSQAHGNVKLTTVLLPRGGESAYGQAVLAEPLLPHKAATVTEAADVGDVAKLVYHLVVHRPFSEGGGAITAGPEWVRLGPRGEAWRELCNTLLDPANAAGGGDATRGLDFLDGVLKQLKPRRRLVPVKVRVAAVVVALLAGIGYGLYVHYAPYFRYSAKDWVRLVDAYAGWLRALDQTDPLLKQLNDPELNAILTELKGADIPFDTKLILGERGEEFAYEDAGLRDVFPKTAEAQRLTRRAVEYIPIVEERLKQWKPLRLAREVAPRCKTIAPKAEEELLDLLGKTSTVALAEGAARSATAVEFAEAIVELSTLATALETIERDLRAIAAVEGSLVKELIGTRAVFPDLPKELVRTYRRSASVGDFAARLAKVKDAVDSIARDWGAVGPRLRQIHDAQDDVLRSVPDFVHDGLYGTRGGDAAAAVAMGDQELPTLAERVRELNARFGSSPWSDLHARAIDWGAGRIDKEEFRKTEAYTAPDGKSPEERLRAWGANAGKYLKLPPAEDPRPALAIAASQVEQALSQLDADYQPPTPVPAENSKLKERAEAWKQGMAALQKPKWLGGWREEIERDAKARAAELAELLRDIELARTVPIEELNRFVESLAERGARLGHPALVKQWQVVQGEQLKDLAAWRRDPKSLRRPAFGNLQKALERVEGRLSEIASLPRGLTIEAVTPAPAWHDGLVAELERLRAVELDKAVDLGIRSSDWSNLAGDGFGKQWPVAKAAYVAWCADASSLLRDLSFVQALLDGGYGIRAPADAAYARAKKSRQWDAAAKLVQALVERIDKLANLKGGGSELLALAKDEDEDLSLAVEAWRQVGNWPNSPAELGQELEVQKEIRKRVGDGGGKATLPEAEQVLAAFRKALVDEQQARRQSAWRRLAEEVDHGQEARERLDALMARMTECDIVPSLELKAETRFNIALYRFRKEVQEYKQRGEPGTPAARVLNPKEQDEHATARLRQFEREIPEELRTKEGVRSMLKDFEKQAEPSAPGQAVVTADGPPASPLKQVVWQPEKGKGGGDGDKVRTYQWRTHTLRFRRLPQGASADGAPVFLCTSEVSLGLFREVINVAAAAEKAERLKFAGLKEPDPFGVGPHVWTATLKPQRNWLILVPATIKRTELYPKRFFGVDSVLQQQGDQLPLQRIPAAAAMHFAHLMGCRLPTSAEVAAALKSGAVSDAIPNLRDAAWLEQHRHIAGLVATVAAGELAPPWPDDDAYASEMPGVPRGANAQPVVNAFDDNCLWFRAVHDGDTFGDLNGNVAEWVWDDGKALEAARTKSLGAFRDMVTKQGGKNLFIVGGSAISPFKGGVDPCQVGNRDAGFADVGFRLAFSVPPRTIVDRIRLMADKQQYARAGAGGAAAGEAAGAR